jgi:hypothetical protein
MPKPRATDRAADTKKPAPKPEWSRPVDVSRMGRLEHRLEIKANAEERAALARRFDLVELAALSAALVLKKRGDGVVELGGRYRARLAQASVVSLAPVWSDFEDEVRLFFGERSNAATTLDPFAEDEETEPIEGGAVDVGEAVAQLLAVRLDPYPRLPEEEASRSG